MERWFFDYCSSKKSCNHFLQRQWLVKVPPFKMAKYSERFNQRRRSSVLSYDPSSSVIGQYREELASLAQSQAQKTSKKDVPSFQRLRNFVIRGGDWLLLAILGVSMAMFSYMLEGLIKYFYHRRDELLEAVDSNFWLKFVIWTIFPVILIVIAMVIVRVLAPQAAGSGVSEMKVILRGVVLKEYLSFPTLVAKVLSLPLVIGSGLPLGKDVSTFVRKVACFEWQVSHYFRVPVFTSLPSWRAFWSNFVARLTMTPNLSRSWPLLVLLASLQVSMLTLSLYLHFLCQ